MAPPIRVSPADDAIISLLNTAEAQNGLSANTIWQSVSAHLNHNYTADNIQKRLRKLLTEGRIFRYYRWTNRQHPGTPESPPYLYPVREYWYFNRPNPTPEDAEGIPVFLVDE